MAERGAKVGFTFFRGLDPDGSLLPGPSWRWNGGAAGLAAIVNQAKPEWLWVQLSGYGYARWGAPWKLAHALAYLRRRRPDVRIAVYVHETHCEPHQLGRKGFLVSPWQRHTVGNVVRSAHRVFTSTPFYQRRIIEHYGVPGDQVSLLPIGSNIPSVELTEQERDKCRDDLGISRDGNIAVTFGRWASQVSALRSFDGILRAAFKSGRIHRLVALGGDTAPRAPAFQSWLRQNWTGDELIVLGQKPPEEIARWLCACDIGLAVTERHQLCKSGSFHAMAVNGLTVLVAGEGDPGFGLNQLNGCMSPKHFATHAPSNADLRNWGSELKKHAHDVFCWDRIAMNAIRVLGPSVPQITSPASPDLSKVPGAS